MAKIILTVAYEIVPEQRSNYLEFMKKVKEYIKSKNSCEYSLFEMMSRKNWFTEIYTFKNTEDYDNFEEVEDEKMEDLLEELNNNYVKDGKVKSSQMIEVF
jgi:hypothetical protein